MSQALRKFLFSSPFVQPFLIEQGQRVGFIRSKAGAELWGWPVLGDSMCQRESGSSWAFLCIARSSWEQGGFYPLAAMQPCPRCSRARSPQRTGNLSPPFETVRGIRLAEYHRAVLFILELIWASRASGYFTGFLFLQRLFPFHHLGDRWDPNRVFLSCLQRF